MRIPGYVNAILSEDDGGTIHPMTQIHRQYLHLKLNFLLELEAMAMATFDFVRRRRAGVVERLSKHYDLLKGKDDNTISTGNEGANEPDKQPESAGGEPRTGSSIR